MSLRFCTFHVNPAKSPTMFSIFTDFEKIKNENVGLQELKHFISMVSGSHALVTHVGTLRHARNIPERVQKPPVLQVLVSKTTINMRLKISLSILVWVERVTVLKPVRIWLNM